MKLTQRIIIYPNDIALITGRSERYGRNLIKKIKLHYKKQEHQMVTFEEFADYIGVDLEKVLERVF